MKKLAILLALATFLGCVAGCSTETAPAETTVPALPQLTGTVAITGEAVADGTVKAQATLDQAAAELTYEWALDGTVLAGFTGETCQIPVSAGGKKLTVSVKSAACSGSVTSEAMNVTPFTGTKMTMAGLYNDVKILGRTPISGTAINTGWPGSGFEIKVNSTGNPMKICVNAGTNSATIPYYCVVVDGEQVDRPMFMGTLEYSLELAAGEHTVQFYRDSANSPGVACKIEYVDFDGTILEKPADKPLYIEVVGDSIACGLGALGTYTPNVDWVNEEHSVSHSFGWYVAQDFGADISVIAKGGIGAVKAANDKNMPQIYPYINGYVDQTPYAFTRKPDLVLVELGANDGSFTVEEFTAGLTQVYEMILDGYGKDTKILWVGKNAKFCAAAEQIATDLGITPYAMTHKYGVSGSGPSIAGAAHPDKEEHRAYADAITQYIKDNNLLP